MKTFSGQHKKHTSVTKPDLGQYGRNEWAILGTKCNLIKELSYRIIQHLKAFKVCYIDADHKTGDSPLVEHSAIRAGGSVDITDAIHYLNIKMKTYPNPHEYKSLLYDQDVILINGNHFQATRQILFLDPNKTESVRKRIDQLTQVDAIVKLNGTQVFDFVKDKISYWDSIPTFDYDQIEAIAGFIRSKTTSSIAPIKGLVLAGGKSTRMGKDKGNIDYHGIPQKDYLYSLLNDTLGIPTWMSCRSDQKEFLLNFNLIEDTVLGLGPFGAILSAFREDPNAAWLVVACDLPNITASVINYLIEQRNSSADATCFHNEKTGFPDPLVTLFEPKCYPRFYQFLTLGYSCPRKVLINSSAHIVKPLESKWLTNVNTPDELAAFQK